MKILLINPPPISKFEKHWAGIPVLGLAYIASSLIKNNHSVKLKDGKLCELSMEDIVFEVLDFEPDLICVTSMTVEYPVSTRIASFIKRIVKTPILVGGAHVNAVKKQALEECMDFDYACDGEGEILVNDLLEALAGKRTISNIQGLLYRGLNKEIKVNESRPYLKDYDILPFPTWGLFNISNKVIPIITHRGCPFKCVFCSHNSGFKPRYRSVQNVIKELKEIIEKFSPEVIRFEDETFGLNMERTKDLLYSIIEAGLHRNVTFSAQTRVDKIDEEFIKLLKQANFTNLEIGVESGNSKILKSIRKNITLEQVEKAVLIARNNSLNVWCKFILGHPHETIQTLKDTINFIVNINPDRLSVSIMTPYPGTPIYDMAIKGEGGYVLNNSSGWNEYDKYSAGVLELEDVSLRQLKFYQIWAYVKLYIFNFRFNDIFSLVIRNRIMAKDMLMTLAKLCIKNKWT